MKKLSNVMAVLVIILFLCMLLLPGCGGTGGGSSMNPLNVGSSEGSAPFDLVGMTTKGGEPNLRKIVVFNEGVTDQDKEEKSKKHGTLIKKLGIVNATVVEVKSEEAVGALKNEPGVLRVENDEMLYAIGKPAPTPPPPPPGQILELNITRIHANNLTQKGTGVRVAILDSGIDLTHPDLKDHLGAGYNCITPSKSANDDNGHGSHCAGIVGALDNTVGVVGVAPGVTLLPVKFLTSRGTGLTSDAIEGVEWCMGAGNAKVINMSFGNSSPVQAFHDALIAAKNAGIILVGAAGNSASAVIFPAAWPEVIAVTAFDHRNDGLYSGNCYGPEVDLTAPGVSIRSTYKSGGYATATGTSMAAPHVAGCAALLVGQGIYTTPDTVKNRLAETAEKTLGGVTVPPEGNSNQIGQGVVNARAAVGE